MAVKIVVVTSTSHGTAHAEAVSRYGKRPRGAEVAESLDEQLSDALRPPPEPPRPPAPRKTDAELVRELGSYGEQLDEFLNDWEKNFARAGIPDAMEERGRLTPRQRAKLEDVLGKLARKRAKMLARLLAEARKVERKIET